ncbi:MAG: response regulator transcription factor [Alphaproteobacteria bacterium GM7ARS4]|nr:response regulator transcription factor [Alphaproteobacteria bacterium GM7ARS4]
MVIGDDKLSCLLLSADAVLIDVMKHYGKRHSTLTLDVMSALTLPTRHIPHAQKSHADTSCVLLHDIDDAIVCGPHESCGRLEESSSHWAWWQNHRHIHIALLRQKRLHWPCADYTFYQPFSMRDIFSLFYDSGGQEGSIAQCPPKNVYRFGPYVFDGARRMLLRAPHGEEVALSEQEKSLCVLLTQAGGRSVSKAHMMRVLAQLESHVESHRMETLVYRLRQKIEVHPSVPCFLRTTEDGGYCLALS